MAWPVGRFCPRAISRSVCFTTASNSSRRPRLMASSFLRRPRMEAFSLCHNGRRSFSKNRSTLVKTTCPCGRRKLPPICHAVFSASSGCLARQTETPRRLTLALSSMPRSKKGIRNSTTQRSFRRRTDATHFPFQPQLEPRRSFRSRSV